MPTMLSPSKAMYIIEPSESPVCGVSPGAYEGSTGLVGFAETVELGFAVPVGPGEAVGLAEPVGLGESEGLAEGGPGVFGGMGV